MKQKLCTYGDYVSIKSLHYEWSSNTQVPHFFLSGKKLRLMKFRGSILIGKVKLSNVTYCKSFNVFEFAGDRRAMNF